MQQSWQDFLLTQGGTFKEGQLTHFGSPKQELIALEEKNCLIPLTHLGLLCFQGEDAKTFLQGQVTCNLNEISPDKSLLGAHCNLQGRMLCLFRLLSLDPQNTQYALILPQDMLTLAQQNFKKYALFSKVQIEITTTQVGIGLYGPEAVRLLTQLDIQAPENSYECVSKKTQHGVCWITRLEGLQPRFEIWGPLEAAKQLWENLAPQCDPILPSAWELLDIRAGIPTIHPATVAQVLPHHANLAFLKGISFNKGCYLGQEIIARMHYKGKIKKHLYRAYVKNLKPLPAHVIVSNNDSPGLVLQSAQNAQGNFECLVVLDEQYNHFENLKIISLAGPILHPL